jgi:hypothetical protein
VRRRRSPCHVGKTERIQWVAKRDGLKLVPPLRQRATGYAEKRLVSDGEVLVCPNTGARHFEQHGPQFVSRQIDPEKHLMRRRQR